MNTACFVVRLHLEYVFQEYSAYIYRLLSLFELLLHFLYPGRSN